MELFIKYNTIRKCKKYNKIMHNVTQTKKFLSKMATFTVTTNT